MVEFVEVLIQYIPSFGVIVALIYYAMTIKNTEKLRRKDFIFQSNLTRTPEFFKIWYNIQSMWDYETYEEFTKKFNVEQQADYTYVITVYNVMGTAFRAGVATSEEIFQLYPPQFTISLFEMSWPLIRDLRIGSGNLEYLKPFESLYQEARKMLPKYVPWWQKDLKSNRAVHA